MPATEVTSVTQKLTLGLAGLVAVGTLAATILDIAKSYLRIKPFYYRYELRRFLRAAIGGGVDRAELFISKLSTGSLFTFYSQSFNEIIEDMSYGETRALMDVSEDDHAMFLRACTIGFGDPVNPEQALKAYSSADSTAEQKKAALALIKDMIAANLRGLKIGTQLKWKCLMQLLSVLLSTLLILSFISASSVKWTWLSVLYGIVGGLLAPFAHDLTKKVSSPEKTFS